MDAPTRCIFRMSRWRKNHERRIRQLAHVALRGHEVTDRRHGACRMPEHRQRRSTQRTTMSDVARIAEVSPSTVSLFLRDPDAVSERRRLRIQRAIDTLRYVPNRMAGSLAAASTRVVGVIVPSLVNSFFSETVSTLQTALMAQGYQILIGHTSYDPTREEELVRTFLSWSPSGIVLTGLGHSRATRQMLEGSSVPVVEMWETGPQPIDLMVGFSHADVGRLQARHLIDRGCRAIAFLGAELGRDARASQRAQGYSDVLNSHSGQAPPEIVTADAQSASAGALAFAALHDRRPELDGVVFSNDILALGALSEAQRRGIAIPEQMRMIGFGGLDYTSQHVADLSTIVPPQREIGDHAAALLLARIEGRPCPTRIILDPVPVFRRSTDPAVATQDQPSPRTQPARAP
ncbi:MAG: LacI family DNA-binding transcriptional regulator [Rhodobacteraceae bacterium]|nr:MAG: LacI family DNA-binding transcriptional regulator [Paracoccaceae bacterium]